MSALLLLWRRDTSVRERAVVSFVLALSVAAAVVWLSVSVARPQTLPPGGFYLVRTMDHATSKFELVGVRGDGQFFVAIARDPALRHPGVFALGDGEAAYRAQRPVMSYAAWGLAGGQGDLIPMAIQVVSVLAVGFAAAGMARLRELRRAWRPLYSLVVFLPGVAVVLAWCTSEMVGMALALWALVWWNPGRRDPRRRAAAFTCFALAGLTRETMLLVPFGLLLWGVVTDKRPERRDEVLLAATVVPYLLWSVVVRIRYHAWPETGHPGGFGVPIAGLVRAMGGWDQWSWLSFLVIAVLVVGSATRWRSPYAFTALVYAVFSLTLGIRVWASWLDFSRIMLPLTVLGFVAVLTPARRTQPAVAGPVPEGSRGGV